MRTIVLQWMQMCLIFSIFSLPHNFLSVYSSKLTTIYPGSWRWGLSFIQFPLTRYFSLSNCFEAFGGFIFLILLSSLSVLSVFLYPRQARHFFAPEMCSSLQLRHRFVALFCVWINANTNTKMEKEIQIYNIYILFVPSLHCQLNFLWSQWVFCVD